MSLAARGAVLRSVVVVVAGLLGGCVIPFAIPPTRAEVGASSQVGQAGPNHGFHVGGGAHLASGNQRKDLPLDVGIGGFLDVADHGANTGGVYVDTALFVERHHDTRTSLGMRGELRIQNDAMTGDHRYGAGAKLRIDHEIYGAVSDDFSEDDRCGVAVGSHHGNVGVGVYVEAGPVWQPDDGRAWLATAGLTLRMPSVMGVWVGIPGC